MYVSGEVATEEPEHQPGEEHAELRCLMKSMRSLVDQLADPEGQIIRHHYFHGMQFSDIADLLGLSKSRVSQLHGRALNELRGRYRNRAGLSLEI